jgi:hypothetical protein
MKPIRRKFPEGLTVSQLDEMISRGRAFRGPDGRIYPVFAGGAKKDEDAASEVDELVTRLTAEGEGQGITTLSDDELGDAEQTLIAEVNRLAEEDDSDEALARMGELRDQVEAIRTEAAAREEAAEQRAEQREQILQSVNAEVAEDDGETEGGDGDSDESASDEGDDDSATSDDGDGDGESDDESDSDSDTATTTTTTEVETETEQPQAQAASSGTSHPRASRPSVSSISRRRPARRAPRARSQDRPYSITAAAGVRGVNAGAELDDLDAVAAAIADRRDAFSRGSQPSGREQVTVATIHSEFPEDRRLTDDPERNAAVIASVMRQVQQASDANALTAAGGLCAPVAVRYDLENISTAARPIRDSLPQFQAARGGLRWMDSPAFSDFSDAVGIWDVDDDTAAVDDENVRKPCLRVECGDENTAFIEAITACLEFGNFGARSWPEQTRDTTAKVMAFQARVAERELLRQMRATSTDVTYDQGLGAARQILHVFGVAAAGYRNRHRTAENFPLRAILPSWARELIRTDLANEAPGSTAERLATADATINGFFAVRNINVTWALDGEAGSDQDFGAQAAGQLAQYPVHVIAYLFHEGAFLHLDNGELDLGIVRDSTLNARNDYQQFSESFEALAHVGFQAFRMEIPVCPDGTTSEPVTFDGHCVGS